MYQRRPRLLEWAQICLPRSQIVSSPVSLSELRGADSRPPGNSNSSALRRRKFHRSQRIVRWCHTAGEDDGLRRRGVNLVTWLELRSLCSYVYHRTRPIVAWNNLRPKQRPIKIELSKIYKSKTTRNYSLEKQKYSSSLIL